MQKRAWMEGKREKELAQRIILKADSVLEYSCFNTRMNEMAQFSVFGENLNAALDSSTRRIHNKYIDLNFGHGYAGGTYAGPTPSAGLCNAMGLVWQYTKCADFNRNYFKSFQQLAASDPRNMPTPCNESGRSAKWADAIDVTNTARNTPNWPWSADDEGPWIGIMYNRGNQGTCGSAIATGIKMRKPLKFTGEQLASAPGYFSNYIIDSGVDPANHTYGQVYSFQEHICVVPGCYVRGFFNTCHVNSYQ